MQYREAGQSSWVSINAETVNLERFVNKRNDVTIEISYRPVNSSNQPLLASYPAVFQLENSRHDYPENAKIVYDPLYPDSYILTDIDTTMEYAVTNSKPSGIDYTWEPCTGETMVLEPGSQSPYYLVRYQATDDLPASKYMEVRLLARDTQPSVSYDADLEQLSKLTTAMEYSIDGSEYTAVTEEMLSGDVSAIIEAITETDSVQMNIRRSPNNKPASLDRIITLYKRLPPPKQARWFIMTRIHQKHRHC